MSRERIPETFEERVRVTAYAVEASDFEQLALWQESHERVPWEHIGTGWLMTVGHVNRKPVCVATTWQRIHGQIVMFYEATSRMVDHEMVERWIAKHIGSGAEKRCNAMNFHLCLGVLEKISKRAAGASQ